MPCNENKPELPLAAKLMDGYLEQADLLGPAIVKAAQDFRDAGLSTIGQARNTVLGLLDRTGHKPPFIHTMADAAGVVLSASLKLQCAVVDVGVKVHRQAAQSILETLTGKAPP